MSTAKPCTDHKGYTYKSEKEMCRAYGISNSTFRTRIKYGWTLEDALTIQPVKSLHGNEHIGIRRMMKNGLDAEIIEYDTNEHIKIRFEDNVVTQGTVMNFYAGTIEHPKLSRQKKCEYGPMIIQSIKDTSYYMIECKECKSPHNDQENYKDILTAKAILSHLKKHS